MHLSNNFLLNKISSRSFTLSNLKIIKRTKLLSLTFILSLLTVCNIQAQVEFEWAKGIGGTGIDWGRAVAADANGNVYITGEFSAVVDFDPGSGIDTFRSAGGRDVFLVKYDADGNYLWVKVIGGIAAEQAGSVATDANGNVYMTGRFNDTIDFGGNSKLGSLGSTDAYIAKYDSAGNYLWAISYGTIQDDYGSDLAIDNQGNIYVTGKHYKSRTISIYTIWEPAAFVAKFDTDGNLLWDGSIVGNDNVGNGIDVDPAGNVYVTGVLGNNSSDFDWGADTARLTTVGLDDIFLAKYDKDGQYQWAFNIGSTASDYGNDITVDVQGNAYITGQFYNTIDVDPDLNNVVQLTATASGSGTNLNSFLIKYDSAGKYIWSNSLNGDRIESYSVALDDAGNPYVTGMFSGTVDLYKGQVPLITAVASFDAFLAKYDVSGGNHIWSGVLGGAGQQNGYGITVDYRNSIFTTGMFSGATDFNPGTGSFTISPVSADAYLVKLSQPCRVFNFLTESTCDSFVFNGAAYTMSGVYVDTIALENCDSIVTLDLTINGYASNNPVITGHYCDSVTFNGVTYTTSGIHVQNYKNVLGCDSNIVYDLEIGKSSYDNQLSYIACDSFVYNDTTVYTTTGTYLITFTNTSGCDSTIELDITINSIEAAVARSGSMLTANSADSYQWLDCDKNSVIANAIGQTYTAMKNGNYAVIITVNDCSDTSGCILVDNITSINGLDASNSISLYPNPTDGKIIIQMQQALQQATIKMISIVGQQVAEQTAVSGTIFTVDLSGFAAGVYLLQIDEKANSMWVKVVKQ